MVGLDSTPRKRQKGKRVPTPNIPEERRKQPRVPFSEQVQIYPVTESKSGNIFEVQKDFLTVKAFDLSEGGIRLELGVPDPPAPILKLNFQIQKDRSVTVYGKLAWSSGKFAGCRFIALEKESLQQIQDFLEKLG
jgi:hypothetical protein